MEFLIVYLVGVVISYFYSRYVIVEVCEDKHEDDVIAWVICVFLSWIGILFMSTLSCKVSGGPVWLRNLLYRDKK